MIGRIWRGEIGLAWAFWGVGLLGLYPLIALLLGSVSLGWLATVAKSLPITIRFALLPFFGSGGFKALATGAALLVLIVPTVVIWRSAKRSSSRASRVIAKTYVIFAALAALTGPPVMLFVLAMLLFTAAIEPEHQADTPELLSKAPARFVELTGVELPKGARVVHAVYYRHGTMDYEFGSHIVVDASNLNIREWARTSRPFGIRLKPTLPENQSLEFNAEGLDCGLSKLKAICRYVETPTRTWHYKKRLRMDRVVSITVLEKANIIWLYETSW